MADDDIKAGRVRALALSAPERIPGINVPTARGQGVDAELVNWRGVFAPAGLDAAGRASQCGRTSSTSRMYGGEDLVPGVLRAGATRVPHVQVGAAGAAAPAVTLEPERVGIIGAS